MNSVKVGKVTNDERDLILNIHNRKLSLEELILSISQKLDPDLFKKANKDLDNILIEYNSWWEKMYQKYNWKLKQHGYCRLNFETCEIIYDVENNRGKCTSCINFNK